MKTPASIRNLYSSILDNVERLRGLVDRRVQGHIKSYWHYESRVKSLESYTQKIESGRFLDPLDVGDLFACTIVVRNSTEISLAEEIVKTHFNLTERRPPNNVYTHKDPSSFVFDDLRLYVCWVDDPALPASGVSGFIFEVQIKSYLQHAWGIATHDLVYKTNRPDWGKERIAYQLKALLEHAEASLAHIESLADAPSLPKANKHIQRVLGYLEVITDTWEEADLPVDVLRLANNVGNLCEAFGVSRSELKEMLNLETKEGRGPNTRRLSPYGIVVESFFMRKREAFLSVANNGGRGGRKFFILVPREIEIPADVKFQDWKFVIWVR